MGKGMECRYSGYGSVPSKKTKRYESDPPDILNRCCGNVPEVGFCDFEQQSNDSVIEKHDERVF
jgi:hypothetical protein